jgi:hypothetical protein
VLFDRTVAVRTRRPAIAIMAKSSPLGWTMTTKTIAWRRWDYVNDAPSL